MSDFENHRAEPTASPSDRAELFRIVVLLVDKVRLIENLTRLLQANPVFSFDFPALLRVELEPRRHI
jgi:hypothetical protein